MSVERPKPPAALSIGNSFAPCPGLCEWVRRTFIDDDALLVNSDHAHLQYAEIGFLWTLEPNSRRGRQVVGQAELGKPMLTAGKWMKARIEHQLIGWFGSIPDFVITLDANYAANCTDLEFCALVEHELMHCAQERDEFGAPKFTSQGRPKFATRGHDVEEFIGIVERYGAPDEATQRFIDAASTAPSVGRASIARACGNCLKAA